MSNSTSLTMPPLWQLLWMALAGSLLYLFAVALPQVPCWGLLALVALTAWPIWAYRTGNVLFHRRLVLDGVALPQGRLHRWFWSGHLTQALGVFSALILASLLLALATLLDAAHWTILALDGVLLSLISGPMQRWLALEVNADQAAPLARRWPLMALNLMVLTAGFLVVDFALGNADTRGMAWHQVAEQAFSAEAGATCPVIGWLSGTLAAAQALSWHASTLVIPSLPNPALQLAAWAIVLARAGLLAWLFTNLLLGVSALGERRRGIRRQPDGTLSLAFVYTIIVLAIPYLYATLELRDFDPSTLAKPARELVERINPCRLDPATAALSQRLDASLMQTRDAAITDANARIDDALHELFDKVEQGVDDYLDWYFTVIGEYQRLAALAVGDFGALMSAELEKRLFEDTGFAAELAALHMRLDAARAEHLRIAADALGHTVAQSSASVYCLPEVVDLDALEWTGAALQRDALHASTAAGAGAAAGALTAKLLAKKTGTAITAKLMAKKSVQTAATLAGKVATKKGGSLLLSALGGTALCAPGGPWALICGIGAGFATWFAVDKVVIEIDERRFRDQMRADLLATIEQQRERLAALLRTQQRTAIDAQLLALGRSPDPRFIPARDGLRSPMAP
ncbi:MAG: hypothetical protein N838_25690 [Thiohalocapsa sp. PB-PSB1]|nr:MAG: hypothetical protein N838_25690 [Thiohalocapsa sp. PB-PSB1]